MVLIEPLEIGQRVRDVTVDSRGRIYAKLSTWPLVLRLTNAHADQTSEPEVLVKCIGCHQVDSSMARNGAAPSLVGVMGRRVASKTGFHYSEALSQTGGRWTEARLRDFLTDRETIGAGSAMPRLDLESDEVDRLLRRIEELH